MKGAFAAVLLVILLASLLIHPRSSACDAGLHYSYFSTSGAFDNAYTAAEIVTPTSTPEGLLVNHHLLAAPLIASAFSTVSTTKPITVLLISPNHFLTGVGKSITSTYDWRTPYGILSANCEIVQRLAKSGVVSIEETPFEEEHGISGIVPFIKRSLPNATVVPLIIKDTLKAHDRGRLAEVLSQILPADTLIIGSFDFSHETTDSVAQAQDKQSIEAIHNFDYQILHAVEARPEIFVDSVPGLEVMLRYLQKTGAVHFSLLAHTNSAQWTNRPDATDTTSYITGYFTR